MNAHTAQYDWIQDPREAGHGLPPEQAVLAQDLLTLAQTVQPDPEFVNRLEGELTRKRRASHPLPISSPTLTERLRLVLQTTWGWTLPATAVILLIFVISLLVQTRPRQDLLMGGGTPTSQPTATGTPSPQPTSTPAAVVYVVQAGDTLLEIANLYGVPVKAIYDANEVLSEGVLRPGLALIIPLEARAKFTPGTPTPPPATPAPAAQALLAELQGLIQQRRIALLTGPGWIYVQSDRTDTQQGGQMLPNGRQVPPQFFEYSWYQLNEQGNIHATITRQIDYSDQIYQEVVTQNGLSRNLTFSLENPAPLTTTYETDWGYAAMAADAVARGASLTQVESTMEGNYAGNFVLLLEEEDAQRGGKLQRYATFDPQTGRLLELSTWLDVPGGESELDSGSGLLESMTLVTEQRVDQPPAEALALLEKPLPEYQPVPPQGEPLPPDFDLAHSLLTFQTFAGDDMMHPTFWYGDIYADGIYLVGRVDFGAVPGGFCQRSPDGLKLAFDRATLENEAPAVHQLRWLDLHSPADVHAVLPELQLVSPPVWSPGSDSLAFTACDAAQSCGLYTYETTSQALLRLAEDANATPPVWSPGGVEIAFQTGAGEAPQTVIVDAASGMVIASPGWQPQFLTDWSGFSQCMHAPALAPTLPEAPADWLVYTNPEYGFTFRYPFEATLEVTTNTIQLRQDGQQGSERVLDLGFLKPGEPAEVRNGWLNSGDAGDLVHGGHISLLGQSLTRSLLVYAGKVKVVLYGQVARGGLLFSFRVDDTSPDYEAVDLLAEFQQQVNQVIESFAWIPASGPVATPTAEPSILVVNTQETWVQVYTGPDSQYPQAGELANGAQVTGLGQSADGSWIAFNRPGFPGETVWIPASAVSLSGAELPVLAAPPVPVSMPLPAAPPSTVRIAGRIAFISERDGYPVLYAMNADGSGLTKLVDDLGMLMDPIWSPDGQTLAFTAASRQTNELATFLVGANGGGWSEPAAVTVLAWVRHEALSPDGTRKVSVLPDENGLTAVFVSGADGSNPVNLAGDDPRRLENTCPVWSPDGTMIAYVSSLVDENNRYISTDLYITSGDGTLRTALTDSGDVQWCWPSWSPDGRYIAYTAQGDIYLVRADGTQTWRLTEDPASDYAPAWNPAVGLVPLPGPRPASPVTPTYAAGDEEAARQALTTFLDDLHAGQYAQAVELYGGTYGVLVDINWGPDPRDKVGLLQNACEINGYQCLQARSVFLQARSLPDTFIFVVAFSNADGSLFEQGPCCGADEADWAPVSQFEFVVIKVAGGKFVVRQLPPLLP